MRRLSEGWDRYGTFSTEGVNSGRWDSISGGNTVGSGRFGGFCYSSSIAFCAKNWGANDGTIFVTVAHAYTSTLSGTTIHGVIQLRDGAGAQVSICFVSDGSIVVRSGGTAGTVLATWSGAFLGSRVWNGWTFKIVFHNTNGSVEARKDGATSNSFAVTGVNTRGGTSNAYANTLAIGAVSGTNSNSAFDDLVVFNDDCDWRQCASHILVSLLRAERCG